MRIRVERPHTPYFRYTGPGTLVAKPAAIEPTTKAGRLYADLKRAVIGRPLATEEESGERLSKKKALAIFSSDAISSSAYATEEILRALLIAGSAALALGLPISIAIAVLLGIVAFSYRQVCIAYPTGGGSYSVSKANFGKISSLVAASALMIDYTLTVAVSISSASEQITAALPGLHPFQVEIALGAIALVTLGNLRGLRESGNIFAIPTYLFVGTALTMIAVGAFQIVVLHQGAVAPEIAGAADELAGTALILLLLRAFASGAVALTGTEAIATGVPAFQAPEAKNAARTLSVMALLLATLFIGITFLATGFGIVPSDTQTVISQIAAQVFGASSIGFYLLLTFAALILILAANTSFAAFPRLAAILAHDSFMPRQLAYRGDRLAFSSGIILLGGIAALLVFGSHAETHLLIPLYAIGVFIAFTISQTGMVRHWLRTRAPGWRRRLTINATGAAITGVVAVVVTTVKAPASLLVLVLIPLLVAVMLFINRQYNNSSRQMEVRRDLVIKPPHRHERVVVPVPG